MNRLHRDRNVIPAAAACQARRFHPDYHILTVKMNRGYPTAIDAPGTDVIQGTLDMLILKTLSLEPLHGFGIARRIEQISNGVFKINPGSLLTAFQRLERAGWLDSEWRQTPMSLHIVAPPRVALNLELLRLSKCSFLAAHFSLIGTAVEGASGRHLIV